MSTPFVSVRRLAQRINVSLVRATKVALDFLLVVLTEEYGHDREQVLSRLYGVELMEDNCQEALRRLGGGNIVCADSLTFDYDQFTN